MVDRIDNILEMAVVVRMWKRFIVTIVVMFWIVVNSDYLNVKTTCRSGVAVIML